jgi:hypothetical protein
MIDPDLPATQPIPTIDPGEAIEFLARLREDAQRADRAMRAFGERSP